MPAKDEAKTHEHKPAKGGKGAQEETCKTCGAPASWREQQAQQQANPWHKLQRRIEDWFPN